LAAFSAASWSLVQSLTSIAATWSRLTIDALRWAWSSLPRLSADVVICCWVWLVPSDWLLSVSAIPIAPARKFSGLPNSLKPGSDANAQSASLLNANGSVEAVCELVATALLTASVIEASAVTVPPFPRASVARGRNFSSRLRMPSAACSRRLVVTLHINERLGKTMPTTLTYPDTQPRPTAPHETPASRLGAPGQLLKRLLLGFWGMYFSMVALTNLVDLLGAVGATHWTFLNSGNFGYLQSVVKVYAVAPSLTKGLLAGAFAIEAIGAVLFWRALRARTLKSALQAHCYGTAVWLVFIFMTELFVAYQAESVFRELLLLIIATAICIAVCPDRLGDSRRPAQFDPAPVPTDALHSSTPASRSPVPT
jgi:hypothetical protein